MAKLQWTPLSRRAQAKGPSHSSAAGRAQKQQQRRASQSCLSLAAFGGGARGVSTRRGARSRRSARPLAIPIASMGRARCKHVRSLPLSTSKGSPARALVLSASHARSLTPVCAWQRKGQSNIERAGFLLVRFRAGWLPSKHGAAPSKEISARIRRRCHLLMAQRRLCRLRSA